ncbi:hypothetical protein VWN77_11015, partial [Campylobacter coli]
FLASLSKPDFKINTPKTRDVYIYMPARMSLIFSTVASFSFVDSYVLNLNRHFAYEEFRNERAKFESEGKEITGLEAIKTLDS